MPAAASSACRSAAACNLGRRRYDCQAGQSFAALDFGRGVWPLHTYWTRAAFAAPGGIAGNFGTGWTEASDLRENALWFGGKLSRVLDDVHIREPRDPLAEWRLDSACGRVELLFRPEQLHQARPSVGLFYANTRQWFGRFNGTLRHDDGDCVPVDGAPRLDRFDPRALVRPAAGNLFPTRSAAKNAHEEATAAEPKAGAKA